MNFDTINLFVITFRHHTLKFHFTRRFQFIRYKLMNTLALVIATIRQDIHDSILSTDDIA